MGFHSVGGIKTFTPLSNPSTRKVPLCSVRRRLCGAVGDRFDGVLRPLGSVMSCMVPQVMLHLLNHLDH